jgi:hypothetical protein
MSRIFIVLLLAVLIIPAGVFAATPDLSCPACGAANITGPAGGYGMMYGSGYRCGNGTACEAGTGSPCDMMEGDGKIRTDVGSGQYGRMGNDPGYAGTGGYGMMGGYYGQGPAMMAGMSGWVVGGFILLGILVLVWIIAGILLVLVLYRKLGQP